MPNQESALGMLPKEAITFEVEAHRNAKADRELQDAARTMSVQEAENEIVKLQQLVRGLQQRRTE